MVFPLRRPRSFSAYISIIMCVMYTDTRNKTHSYGVPLREILYINVCHNTYVHSGVTHTLFGVSFRDIRWFLYITCILTHGLSGLSFREMGMFLWAPSTAKCIKDYKENTIRNFIQDTTFLLSGNFHSSVIFWSSYVPIVCEQTPKSCTTSVQYRVLCTLLCSFLQLSRRKLSTTPNTAPWWYRIL